MSLRIKLIAIILFVALVPLTVSAVSALGVHQAAFDAQVSREQLRAATFAAEAGDAYLDHLRSSFELLVNQSIDWTSLSDVEREAALWVAYRTSEDVAAVFLLDANGILVGRSAYTATPNEGDGTAQHPALRDVDFRTVVSKTAEAAMKYPAGSNFLSPIPSPSGSTTLLPLKLVLNDTGKRLLVVFSLERFCQVVSKNIIVELLLLDADRRLVCHNRASIAGENLELDVFEKDTGIKRYRGKEGEMLAAAAPTGLGFIAIVQRPVEEAFSSSRRIRQQTLFWIATSVLVAIGAGWFLARGITRPMTRLMKGTEALARGQLHHRIEMKEHDEFGALARAFDRMSEEISERDQEIRKYNEELQARVEERTLDLVRAHEQLLQSQRVAAVGALGAGLAEEVNDALTGVLGVSQLLLMRARRDPERAKEVDLLESAEKEALHIREVVSRMQRLTKGQGLTNIGDVSPNDLLDATLSLVKRDPSTSMLRFTPEYARDLPKIRGNFMQLQRGVLLVLTNAIEACNPESGRITLRSRLTEEGSVELSVLDNGSGIDPKYIGRIFDPFFTTHKEREGRGMGLAIASRIIEDHKARISVESEPGSGTTVTITFPSTVSIEAVA